MPNSTADKQVEQFHLQLVEFIKKYQFRDRENYCCHGLSVSQCYVLETLYFHGALTVSELAQKMHLDISTITRVFNHLQEKKYVKRTKSELDKRVYYCELTQIGSDKYQEIWQQISQSEQAVLDHFSDEQKELVIEFLEKLNEALKSSSSGLCQS